MRSHSPINRGLILSSAVVGVRDRAFFYIVLFRRWRCKTAGAKGPSKVTRTLLSLEKAPDTQRPTGRVVTKLLRAEPPLGLVTAARIFCKSAVRWVSGRS